VGVARGATEAHVGGILARPTSVSAKLEGPGGRALSRLRERRAVIRLTVDEVEELASSPLAEERSDFLGQTCPWLT
jgi:hypothetical protein